MPNFYKVGTGYFTTDGRRIANTSDLQGLAKTGGVEVDPTTKQPIKQQSTIERPGAYGASDWRSLQAMKDSASGLIDILNKKNADLTESQNYFTQAYKDTSAFGGPRDVTTQPNAMITSNKNFRELSPSEQASIIASRQSAALVGLQTVADERASREKVYGSGMDNLTTLYKEQQAAKEREIDNERQDRSQMLQYGAGYYDDQGNFVKGQPVDNYNDYLDVMKQYGTSQGYDTSVDYIKGRNVHGGYDIKTPIGTPASSPVDGVIIDVVGNQGGTKTGWGNYVIVRDAEGRTWRLSHLDSPSSKIGENVSKGDVLGYTGNSGKSTGPHLHIEAKDKNGKLIDFNNKTSSSGGSRNKQSETSLMKLSEETGIPYQELKTYTAQEIVELENDFKNIEKTPEVYASNIIKKLPEKTQARLFVGNLGQKFGGEVGLKALLEAYLEGWQVLNSYLYDSNGNIKFSGATQDDIDALYEEFGKIVLDDKESTI